MSSIVYYQDIIKILLNKQNYKNIYNKIHLSINIIINIIDSILSSYLFYDLIVFIHTYILFKCLLTIDKYIYKSNYVNIIFITVLFINIYISFLNILKYVRIFR